MPTESTPVTPEVVVVPTKGFFNSETVKYALLMITTAVCDKLNDNFGIIVDAIVGVAPAVVDPFVPSLVQIALSILFTLLGYKTIKARTDVGDIKGLYKKPSGA